MTVSMDHPQLQHDSWTFLSNHGHVLICLAQDPTARLRDIANRVGITERAVHKIVSDLQEAGILTKIRDGRRNHYQLHLDKPLRHPIESHCTVRSLLDMLV
jgi:DNA-binding MarR family transcriptional regulator